MSEEDIKRIREILEINLKQMVASKLAKVNNTEKKIYDLTGEIGQTEMVKQLKISSITVTNTWKKLESEGLLIKEGKSYRKVA